MNYVLSLSDMSDILQPMDCSPPGSSDHGDPPGKNIGMGCHTLFHTLAQGSNQCLLCPPTLAGEFFTISTSWEAPRFVLAFGNLKGDLFPFYYLCCLAEGLAR